MPDRKEDRLKPTVFVPPAKPQRLNPAAARIGPATAAEKQPAARPAPDTPTAIAGVERKRIPVQAKDLRQLSPGVDNRVVELALRDLAGFVVEKASERRAILWGHELQKSHGDFVNETLALSQTPILRKVEGYLVRMTEILQSVDIMAVCGYDDSVFGGYLKGVNAKIDRPEELGTARVELDQLVGYMDAALEELLKLRQKLETHGGKLDEIATEVEASALAALFLSQHLREDKPSVAQRLLDRSMSLTQTLAQIRGNRTIRDVQIDHPLRMIGAIQNVVLVTMPDFLASIASVISLAARKASLSQTEAGELNYKLRDIINRLAT